MATKIQLRRGTDAEWTSDDPVLSSGEVGVVSDRSGLGKVGDGSSAWSELPYFGSAGWVNVKNFGATGDGVTDDTVAFQTALAVLDGPGGQLYIPSGHYVINEQLDVPANTRVSGSARSTSADTGSPGTYIDASGFSDVANQNANPTQGCVFKIPSGQSCVTIEHLKLEGAGPSTPPGFGSLGGLLWGYVGIFMSSGASNRIRDVTVQGFSSGIVSYDNHDLALESVWIDNCWMVAFVNFAGSFNRATSCQFANSGVGGAANGGNIVLLPAGGNHTNSFQFVACNIDESTQRSVWVHSGQDVSFIGCMILSGHSAKGCVIGEDGEGGWGSQPNNRVSLTNCMITPFFTNVQDVNLEIAADATGTVLMRVDTTIPNGGTDIDDNAADTIYVAVNGVYP